MMKPTVYATYKGGPMLPIQEFDDFLEAGFLTDTAGRAGKFDETADSGEWLVTVVDGDGDNAETITIIDDGKGGWLKLLNNDKDNDCINMQKNGEMYKADAELNYETRLRIIDVSETDFMFGLGISDTEALGSIDTAGANPGISDFIGFLCPDSSGNVYAATIKDSVVTIADTGVDVADATANTFSFEYDADAGEVKFYIDGNHVATSSTNIPTDQTVSPLYQVRNDGAVAQSMEIDYYFVQNKR